MNKSDIIEVLRILDKEGYPKPVIGGTSSLFLQGFPIEPHDLDLYYNISKEEFLKRIHYKECPKFSISVDWNFYPNLQFKSVKRVIDNIEMSLQNIDEVLAYKIEGIEEEFFSEDKIEKHLRFLKSIKDSIEISDQIKSQINKLFDNMKYKIYYKSLKGPDKDKEHSITLEGPNLEYIRQEFRKEHPQTEYEMTNMIQQGNKLFDSLQSVKDQLFDAPDEIKGSFNQVVKYFDKTTNVCIFAEPQFNYIVIDWAPLDKDNRAFKFGNKELKVGSLMPLFGFKEGTKCRILEICSMQDKDSKMQYWKSIYKGKSNP